MRRAIVLLVPVAIAAACGTSRERAPAAPDCPPGVNCVVGPGPGGSNTPADAADGGSPSDAPETGDGSASLRAIVRPLSRFVDNPGAATMAATTVTLRAPRAGGGPPIVGSPLPDGTFAISGVAAARGAPTWLEVMQSDVVRTIAGVALPQPADTTLPLPLFQELLPQQTWTTIGPSATYPSGSATVVAHVLTAAGARRMGVTAAPAGTAAGPYYDDGSDVSRTAVQTGALGTIVFLGITGATNFPLNLTAAMTAGPPKTYGTLQVPLASNAVTHIAVALE